MSLVPCLIVLVFFRCFGERQTSDGSEPKVTQIPLARKGQGQEKPFSTCTHTRIIQGVPCLEAFFGSCEVISPARTPRQEGPGMCLVH